MPAEIADSDDESIIAGAEENKPSPPPSTLERDPLREIVFDQFLSPTQKLSSFDAQDALPNGTTSTDRFLDEVAPIDSSQSGQRIRMTMMSSGQDSTMTKPSSKKRLRSEINDLSSSSKKRSKTYGQSRSVQPGDASLPATDNTLGIVENNVTLSMMQNGNDFKSYPQSNVMRSSMGGYELKSYNFSTGNGIDFNPFGTLSQISLDGEPDPETEKVVNLFKNARASKSTMSDIPEVLSDQQLQEEDGQIHAGEPRAAAELVRAPTMSQLTDEQIQSMNESHEAEEMRACDEEDEHNSKRRQEGSIDHDQDSNSADELALDKSTNGRRNRAATVDASLDPIPASTGKRRSEKSKQSKSSETPKKQISSELGLENEAIIGLPKEMYKPRPSRRRAKSEVTTIEEQKEDDDDEELNQSNKEAEPIEVEISKPAKKSKRGRLKKDRPISELQEEIEDTKTTIDETEPGSISRSKLEIESEAEQVNNTEKEVVRLPKQRISIDVPVIVKNEDSSKKAKPGPKKRGRISKKKVEVEEVTIEEDTTVDEHHVSEQKQELNTEPENQDPIEREEESSKVLTEKDTNVPVKEIPSNTTAKDELILNTKPKVETKENHNLPTPPSTSNSTAVYTNKYRIGLSKRYSIPSLLSKVDRAKDPPKVVEKKEKLTKKQAELLEKQRLEMEDRVALGMDLDGDVHDQLRLDGDGRGKDGFLVEWND